jgi:hypothetical protein
MDTQPDPGTAAERPKSMTFVAVLLLGGALFGAGALLLSYAIPAAAPDAGFEPPEATRWLVSAAGALVRAIAGFGVLRRWGWTRWVYAAWAVPFSGISLASDPLDPRTIFACAVMWLTVALLITPVANAWFRGNPQPAGVADAFR